MRSLKVTTEFTGIITIEIYEVFNKLELNIYLYLSDNSYWQKKLLKVTKAFTKYVGGYRNKKSFGRCIRKYNI